MNIGNFLSRFSSNTVIHIGNDIECTLGHDKCPHLRCANKRNLKRALYHKVRHVRISESGLQIEASPFYEENREFDLRDLLLVTLANNVQVQIDTTSESIRIAGAGSMIELLNTDNPILYRKVRQVSYIEGGVIIISLMPSMDEILEMLL